MLRFWPTVFLLAGAALLLNGLQYLALIAGTPGPGYVEYSLHDYGSRGETWTIHYVFRAGTREVKGSATGSGSMPRGAALTILYLPFWPAVNHPGTWGMLLFYGLLSALPGLILVYFAQRSLRRPPAPPKGAHSHED
jgi:hypothetical protein